MAYITLVGCCKILIYFERYDYMFLEYANLLHSKTPNLIPVTMRNRLTVLLLLLVLATMANAQARKFSAYYYQRATLFEKMTDKSGGIIFIGDSITDGGEWCTLFGNPSILNFGISGDISEGVLARINSVTQHKPKKLFLMIGINDLASGISPDSISKNIVRIIDNVQQNSPKTKIYVQSVLPVNPSFSMFSGHVSKGKEVIILNGLVKSVCEAKNCTFIDLYSSFKMPDSELLNPQYTNDGLHLLGDGYILWSKLVSSYVK